MLTIVLKGDKANSGSMAQEDSSLMNVNGVPIARKGDNVIAEGCSHYDDKDKSINTSIG